MRFRPKLLSLATKRGFNPSSDEAPVAQWIEHSHLALMAVGSADEERRPKEKFFSFERAPQEGALRSKAISYPGRN